MGLVLVRCFGSGFGSGFGVGFGVGFGSLFGSSPCCSVCLWVACGLPHACIVFASRWLCDRIAVVFAILLRAFCDCRAIVLRVVCGWFVYGYGAPVIVNVCGCVAIAVCDRRAFGLRLLWHCCVAFDAVGQRL